MMREAGAARALVLGKAPPVRHPPQGLAPITLQRPQEVLQALLELGGRGFRRSASKTLRAAHGFRGSGGVMRFAVAVGLVLALARPCCTGASSRSAGWIIANGFGSTARA